MTWKKGDDGQYVRTVRCGHCFDVGHNSSSCPAKKRYIEKMREEHPDSYTVRNYDKAQSNRKKRSCSYCKQRGHNVRSCPVMSEHIEVEVDNNKIYRATAYEHIKNNGLGIGALVKINNYRVESHITTEALGFIESIDWDKIVDQGRYGWRAPQALIVNMQFEDYYGRTKERLAIPWHPDLCTGGAGGDYNEYYEVVVPSERVDPPAGWFDMSDKPKQLRKKIRDTLKDEGHYYVSARLEDKAAQFAAPE